MMKRLLALLAALTMLLAAAGALAETDLASLYKPRDTDASWVEATAMHVTFADGTVTSDAGDALQQSGSTVVLTKAGDWVLSGSWEGTLLIRAGLEDHVHVILNGVNITAKAGPAIREDAADSVILTLAPGTENTLVSEADGPDGIHAAVYTEDDLSINGSGTLVVSAVAGHGIQCRADLILADGTIRVSATRDGIRGRNSLLTLGGNLDITCGGDALSATRTERDDKGWMVLAGGKVTVLASSRGDQDASMKGIKPVTSLTVIAGEYDLTCVEDGLRAADIEITGGTFRITTGDEPLQADHTMAISGAEFQITVEK